MRIRLDGAHVGSASRPTRNDRPTSGCPSDQAPVARPGCLVAFNHQPPQTVWPHQPWPGDMPGRQPCPRLGPVDEGPEGQAVVDVIDYGHPTGPQDRPCGLELKPLITAGVQAVVDEDVDRPELVQQGWEPFAGRPLDIRPAGSQDLRRPPCRSRDARLNRPPAGQRSTDDRLPLRSRPSSMTRLVSPCATPVSTTLAGRKWATSTRSPHRTHGRSRSTRRTRTSRHARRRR